MTVCASLSYTVLVVVCCVGFVLFMSNVEGSSEYSIDAAIYAPHTSMGVTRMSSPSKKTQHEILKILSKNQPKIGPFPSTRKLGEPPDTLTKAKRSNPPTPVPVGGGRDSLPPTPNWSFGFAASAALIGAARQDKCKFLCNEQVKRMFPVVSGAPRYKLLTSCVEYCAETIKSQKGLHTKRVSAYRTRKESPKETDGVTSMKGIFERLKSLDDLRAFERNLVEKERVRILHQHLQRKSPFLRNQLGQGLEREFALLSGKTGFEENKSDGAIEKNVKLSDLNYDSDDEDYDEEYTLDEDTLYEEGEDFCAANFEQIFKGIRRGKGSAAENLLDACVDVYTKFSMQSK